jgi:type II secretory pathway pseudopilin PulG
LSLLELLVVLTILIALGGIVVSTLPGLLERTQVATAAANVPQIDSSIRQNAIIRQGRIGDRFDSLVVGSTSLNGTIPSYLGGANLFQTVSVNAGEVFALQRIGISELVPAVAQPQNATFDSHNQPAVKLTPDAKLCALKSADSAELVRQLWNVEPAADAKYVVLGIGSRSTLVGSGKEALFAEAPVHFSDNQLTNPKIMYSRYLLVIEIRPDGESAATARYLGTCAPGTKGLSSISQILQKHYNSQL